MTWTSTASLLLAAAVALGAFGAHGLKEQRLSEYSLGIWEKAVFYHFVHALGILIATRIPNAGRWVPILFLSGIVLFSGSLYILAISQIRILGAVTPFGGAAFIAAWILLAIKMR